MGPYGARHASANIVSLRDESTFHYILNHVEKIPTNILFESISASEINWPISIPRRSWCYKSWLLVLKEQTGCWARKLFTLFGGCPSSKAWFKSARSWGVSFVTMCFLIL